MFFSPILWDPVFCVTFQVFSFFPAAFYENPEFLWYMCSVFLLSTVVLKVFLSFSMLCL